MAKRAGRTGNSTSDDPGPAIPRGIDRWILGSIEPDRWNATDGGQMKYSCIRSNYCTTAAQQRCQLLQVRGDGCSDGTISAGFHHRIQRRAILGSSRDPDWQPLI